MYDLIAIGDIVVDTFIKLKEATINHDTEHGQYTLTIPFGDKIPYESVDVISAVGNSANAAVSASRLGLSSALISNLGKDKSGEMCLESLGNNGVATNFISIHDKQKTNSHYVLWYENDRTILIKHEEYDYKLPKLNKPKWLYLSSLGRNSLEYHRQIISWLEENPDVSLAFQPGTFQIELGKEELKDIYNRTHIFFCNVAEAEQILDLTTLGVQELLERMFALGPKIVVITDGPKGAYAFDGHDMLFISPYPDPQPPLERTGAGDAFASTVVSALILDKDLNTALMWGAINSMSVVGQVGAQRGLLGRDQLEGYIKDAPTNFMVKKLN